MDWSKAKTIIIIAFIITNLLLGYMIIGDKTSKDPTLTDEFIENVVGLLKEDHIYVDVDLPRDLPKLNTITVAYETTNPIILNKKFFDDEGILQERDGEKILKRDSEELSFTNKTISYTNKEGKKIYDSLDMKEAERLSKKFLLDRAYPIEDLGEAKIFEDGEGYRLSYSKKYKGNFVEDAYTSLRIDKRGVYEFERSWLKIQDEGDKELVIETAPKAVLDLLAREEFKDRRIVDISLCYYFNQNVEDLLEEPIDSIEGRTVPAWRIEFDNGARHIVDEY